MYRDITKTNKIVQRHYKDKHKCKETLQRQTKMYRDTTNTNTMSRDITKTNKNIKRHYKYKHNE